MADEIDTYKSEDPIGDPVLNRTIGMFEWGDYTLVAQFKTQKVR